MVFPEQALQLRQLLTVAGQKIGQPEQQRAALRVSASRARSQTRLALAIAKLRLPDIRRRHFGNRFASGGVYHRQRRSVAGHSLRQ